jgi:hypothetical protein
MLKSATSARSSWTRGTKGVTSTFSTWLRNHRKTAALTTLSVLATSIVVPYAVHASSGGQTPAASTADTTTVKATTKAAPVSQPADSTEDTIQAQPSGENSSRTSVTVNGQAVDVPANGTYSKTTTDGNSQTRVNVDSSHKQTSSVGPGQSGSVSNQSSSSVNVNVNSSSSSESSDD